MSALPSYEAFQDVVRRRYPAPSGSETVAVEEAVGRVLRSGLAARSAYPRFDNSAVDGYAIGHGEDAAPGSGLRLLGAAAAGDAPMDGIERGTCVRILTGAAVPGGTWAVAMQEDVDVVGAAVTLGGRVRKGDNIRRAGEDYAEGVELLAAGSRIGPGTLALFAEQGVAEVEVWARPRVGILSTGAELVDASEEPPPGCLRDSNGPMLAALVARFGGHVIGVRRCGDTLEATEDALASLAQECDVVLTAGGVSVGDRDHVPAAVAALGEVVAHGVRVKPGKPVLAGTVGRCLVLGLPGNPASAFVAFHLFARELLRAVSGEVASALEWRPLPFASDRSAGDRDEFVRCVWANGAKGGLVPAGEQGSFGVRSLAMATHLVRLEAGRPGSPGTPRPTLEL